MFLRKDIFVLPSLAALAVVGTSLSAHAQTATPVDAQQLTEPSATVLSSNQENTEPGTQIQEFSTVNSVSQTTESQQFPSVNTEEATTRTITPVPGTVATTSSTLAPESGEPTSQGANAQAPTSTIAQSDIDPGRPTRGGRSYLGIGANIGISGDDSSLGDGNFAVLSKIGLTNAFSIRPSAIFGNNTTILVPVTYDFNLQSADAFSEPLAIAPYVGVGAAIKTGDDSQVGFLASGGIDFPLSTQFTATAAVNAGFFDDTDVGLLIGVGYNFSGF
ncbi:hypothetical protein [Anabaena azotica]|uniref:Outer membrane protein beta-barrel domain-containing protein n=1 Tax=Anabaena azotica FACHB-119 TaxID=947527 RepID=A0ABR8DBH9_9NOST|nr:hypothetical protein [Anabaena azotica]MBD2503818.1 hypothetical protein [Anabaena azotica FACHB-119]